MTAVDPGEQDQPDLDDEGIEQLLAVQDGVVSRCQLRELGARDHDIVRLLRRRDLTRVHTGVYANTTGELTWTQRAWAAVLAWWPAALSHESALPTRATATTLHVAVAHGRAVRRLPGVRLHRVADLDARVRWVASPPRVRVEHAAIDVALTKSGVDARFKLFADVCQTRETSATLILAAMAQRPRVADRKQLADLLTDLATGACSVLEREYLRLERLHGLPDADRQRSDDGAGRRTYVDAPYADYGVRVELDGRAYHDNAEARDADAERDLDARVGDDDTTVRLTYGQVFGRGCQTVRKVATLLERRGWPGPFLRCPECS